MFKLDGGIPGVYCVYFGIYGVYMCIYAAACCMYMSVIVINVK